MAIKITRTCDHPQNGKEHEATFEAVLRIGREEYTIDLCEKHRGAFLKVITAAGMEPRKAGSYKSLKAGGPLSGRSKGSKKQREHVAASGAHFTAAEARAWLTEQGHDVRPTGRLTTEQTEAYAAAH